MMRTITFSRDEFNNLLETDKIWYDTDQGIFDSEKGAMYDFPFYYEKEGKTYTWNGGYYTGPTGVKIYENEFIFEEDEEIESRFEVSQDYHSTDAVKAAFNACQKLVPDLKIEIEEDEHHRIWKYRISLGNGRRAVN